MIFKKTFITSFLFFNAWISLAQDSSITSDKPLKDVIVTVFNSRVKWKETPASVAIIGQKDFQAFSAATVLPALNRIPGVRMEERSPGSYRLSIRGSLLRSPFGVRNIKVYWNQIPFSDATGNTYLNLIDLTQMDQIEIAKGPASSMYGAGTGGVLLMQQNVSFSEQPQFNTRIEMAAGSYGYNQQQLSWQYNKKQWSTSLQFHRLSQDGYREHSAVNRSGLFWQNAFQIKKHAVKTGMLFTDLFYQTPGGITAAQMLQNPRLSRQATPSLPGAIEQNASIRNKTLWVGLQDQYQINQFHSVHAFVGLAKTNFENPFITNYEKRNELNLMTGIQWTVSPTGNPDHLQWTTGAEYMANEARIKNYTNNKGAPGNLFADDIVYSQQGFVFTQIKWKPLPGLLLQGGLSINQQDYMYKLMQKPTDPFNYRKIASPVSPRFAFNYAVLPQFHLYGVVSRGFSAPTLAEIRPSDGQFYPLLNAEQGWNIEGGVKGFLADEQIVFDLSYYRFNLNNAIVRRTDAGGNDYFVNAGSTRQHGAELNLRYRPYQRVKGMAFDLEFMGSFSYQPYRFNNFQQGSLQLNNNPLTGVPSTVWVSGINFKTQSGLAVHLNANFTGKISLNDAATVYADPYQLVQVKLIQQFHKWKKDVQLFTGIDNLLNQVYSLGNDINALGNRYYNTAAGRNFYAGFRISFQ